MDSYYNRNSLLDDIKTAAETGAAIGRRAASMAGGLIGAAVGCICWLVIKPIVRKMSSL